MIILSPLAIIAALVCLASPAQAAGLDGAALRWPWALPFAGMLLTIALGPIAFPKLWHYHYGKLTLAWGLLTVAPLAAATTIPVALEAVVHAVLAEYLSFIVLLFALYVVAGGILITGTLRGHPLVNTGLLAFGTAIASVVGTTGAAMVLIRPLLRANAARQHNVHVVVFFILLVANIGGALSPLGDPPLFVGFLRGVDFFWTTIHLWRETLLVAGLVLMIFLVVDVVFYRRDRLVVPLNDTPQPLRVQGLVNLVLIVAIIAAILLSAAWRPGIGFDVYGTRVELQNIVRDMVMVALALLSLKLTPNEHRAANGFTFEPIREVAILFAGIFICIVPVLAMLQAGRGGAFAWLIAAVTAPDGAPREIAYFWLTGMLSAFLDNAPTYLVFFELAGGDATKLMTTMAPTLAAISMGAVFMGALTYIGNAPNFMIYAIAVERGVRMPSFFVYMAWSFAILMPVFVILSVVSVLRF